MCSCCIRVSAFVACDGKVGCWLVRVSGVCVGVGMLGFWRCRNVVGKCEDINRVCVCLG